MPTRLPTRVLTATGLGLLGLLLNELRVPLLAEEAPEFVFGGAAVLLAYAFCGPWLGTLAALIALAPTLLHPLLRGAPLLYVLEAFVAWWLAQRTGSYVLAVCAFWFVAGWPLDALLYGERLGLGEDYRALLLLKQVLNGALNALVTDGLLIAARRLLTREPEPLHPYATRRTACAAGLLALVLALLYSHDAYQRTHDSQHALDRATTRQVGAEISAFLAGQSGALIELAQRLQSSPGAPQALIEAARAQHPELLNVGLADASGTLLAMSPQRNLLGERIDRGSIAQRDYFTVVRETRRTAFSPLILGDLKIGNRTGPDPIVVVAHPLLGPNGAFAGCALAAIDVARLQPLLAAARRDPQQTLRWIDHLGRTVASSDPAEPAGQAWSVPAEDGRWLRVPERPDGSRRSLLGISPRYVTHEPLDTLSGHVVLETPAPVIRAAMAPQALAGLAAFVTGLVGLVLTLRRLNARLESALIEAGRAAEGVSQGDLQASPATQALGRSLLSEARELGARLEEMRSRLAARVERGQRLLSHALEAGHAGAWTVARAATGELQMSWSPEMSELVGLTADRLDPSPESALALVDPRDREVVEREVQDAFASARAFDFTFRLTRPGERRPRFLRASCRVEPLSGGGLRWEGMAQDVTEETLRERLLASESNILEQVALGAPLPQIFEALCHSLEDRLDGLTASILVVKEGGGVLLDGAGPSLPPAYREALGEVPIGPHSGSCGTAAFRREPVLVDDIAGSPLWEGFRELATAHGLAACWSYPVLAADGEVLGTFALYAAVPGPPPAKVRQALARATQLARIAMERERNRRAMLGTQERLRQSERLGLLGQIVGGVSHEVRNPLFALSASVDALEAHGVGSGTTGRLLANIRGEVDRIGRLMNDLLEYGRPHPLSLAPVEAADLLAEVAAQTARLAAERGVAVDVVAPAGLQLNADSAQLASALRNVVENALFHSPAGARVELRAEAAPGRVRFEVLDRGPGLREDEIGHVFEPFFTHRRGGTGLGLAIVRHVVERHQGQVVLVNRAGGGARATIDVPEVPASPALAPADDRAAGC